MKRYFTFATPPDPATYHPRSFYHWVALPSGGHICVMMDGEADAHSTWTELPHLLDATSGAGLTDFGCVATDTMFQAAKKLAKVNRFFHP